MKTIAVDVDDVLAPLNEAMMHYINYNFGLKLTRDDYLQEGEYWGYWERIWGVDKKEADRRYNSFLEAGALRTVAVMDHAIEAVSKLKEDYSLIIVSARFDRQIEDTYHWLDVHFPEVFKDVRFIPVWDKNSRVTKAMICKEVGAGYLIDDSLEHCTLASQEGIRCLLFGEYGWNKSDKLSDDVRRVKNWEEVLEYFNARAE